MPTLDFTQIGIWVVCFIVLAQIYFQWSSHSRAEKNSVEPKHVPAIDQKIESRVGTTEHNLRAEIERVRAEQKKEDDKLHGRISGLRDELTMELKDTRRGIEGAVKEMRDVAESTAKEMRSAAEDTNAAVNQLISRVDMTIQQQQNTEQKLSRHVENMGIHVHK